MVYKTVNGTGHAHNSHPLHSMAMCNIWKSRGRSKLAVIETTQSMGEHAVRHPEAQHTKPDVPPPLPAQDGECYTLKKINGHQKIITLVIKRTSKEKNDQSVPFLELYSYRTSGRHHVLLTEALLKERGCLFLG